MTETYSGLDMGQWLVSWVSDNGGAVDPTQLNAWALCAPRLANPPG